MPRPTLELADIIRVAGPAFMDASRGWLTWLHVKVLTAILRCRTALLGGHVDSCSRCGYQAISYNSCRNRHCPRCQTQAREQWIAARTRDLLPVRYAHVVFTLPHALVPLALHNKREIYGLLLRASAETLLQVARDPHHLGAEIGFFSILHTWNQQLLLHPHVHCVVPAGGLAPDHSCWVAAPDGFFLPVKVLSRVFRGKFVAGLRQSHARHRLVFPGTLSALEPLQRLSAFLRTLFRDDWVVYSKRPFGGAQHVVHYLGRYTHRIAISNHRLVSLDQGKVTFRWRDSVHHHKQRLLTVSINEFLRRFLLPVLPLGFVRIRHFGLFAHRRRSALLPLCSRLLAEVAQPRRSPGSAARQPLWTCPICGGAMVVIERLTPVQARWRSPPLTTKLP